MSFFLESMYAQGLQFKFINDLTKLIVDELLVKIAGFSSGTTHIFQYIFQMKTLHNSRQILFLKEINLSI